MQSGSVFNSWARGFQNNQLLAKNLKIESCNEKEIIETLIELPIEKLLELQEQLGDVSSSYPVCCNTSEPLFRL